MAQISDQNVVQRRYEHLSTVHPEWEKVSEINKAFEENAKVLFSLPIEEIRKVPYQPAPLPANAPVPGRDFEATEHEVVVRDGAKVRLRVLQPLASGKDRLLYFNIHGGGWTLGTPESEEAQNRAIVVQNNAVVVSVDYRKAPEYPFPYALHDSLDALKWAIKHAESLGVDPKKVVIGGGSAGANLSAVISQIARDEKIEGIIGQVLNIPVTCHPDHFPASKYEYHSYVQNLEAPIVSSATMRYFWNNYLPGAEPDSRASPLLAESLANLPPTLIQVAGMDPLRDEGLAYADALKDSGVDVDVKIYPGMPHAFYMYPDLQPSIEYTQTIVDWIGKLKV